MEYSIVSFDKQTGIMIVRYLDSFIPFDLPIQDNKYITGPDLTVFIEKVVLNSKVSRINDVAAATNSDEVLELLQLPIVQSVPGREKELILKNLKAYVLFVLNLESTKLGFDSISHALMFAIDDTGPLYQTAQLLAKWHSLVWEKYILEKQKIELDDTTFNFEAFRTSLPSFVL